MAIRHRHPVLILVATLLACAPAWGDDEDGPLDRPVLEAIEGDKMVVVRTSVGNRVAEKGAVLDYGDRVKTGTRASARIVYPDGSKILIGRGSEIELQAPPGKERHASLLLSGSVRGLIKKPKVPDLKSPPKFTIRSRAAVMGVRGTDFVFELADTGSKAEVHTLGGLVEMAPTEPDLLEGRGTLIKPEQYANAVDGKVEAPKSFNRQRYEDQLEQYQPEVVHLARREPEATAYLTEQAIAVPSREGEKDYGPRLRLLDFQLGGIGVFQRDTGGYYATAQGSWNPSLRVFRGIRARGMVAVSALKSRSRDSAFIALETGVLVSVPVVGPLVVEGGLGLVTWLDNGGAKPSPLGQVAWSFGDGLFDRVYLGFSTFGSDVGQFKAGLGIRL
jgi:hypothetical protein